MRQSYHLLLWFLLSACKTDVIDPSRGSPDRVMDSVPDSTTDALPTSDAGPCAACDPPRNGWFCGYGPGCEDPMPSCFIDGSGDGGPAFTYCGCNGEEFYSSRFGGMDGVLALDRPHQGFAVQDGVLCAPLDGGPCAGCDPPRRNGFFCGYAPGCGDPTPSCYFDGHRDAGSPPLTFCGCDGMEFEPMRFAEMDGVATTDRPHQGVVEAGVPCVAPDAGPCADCDPARDGLFCGYPPGCDDPMPSCYRDGSGDGGLATYCGCDGMEFYPGRYGGMDGVSAADQPHQGPLFVGAQCTPYDGGLSVAPDAN